MSNSTGKHDKTQCYLYQKCMLPFIFLGVCASEFLNCDLLAVNIIISNKKNTAVYSFRQHFLLIF